MRIPLLLAAIFGCLFCAALSRGQVHQDNLVSNPFANEFQMAYQTYPDVPQGVLEGVAHTTTRFAHLSLFDQESCLGMPRAFTMFGLVRDGKGYFRENLITISRTSGVSISDMITNPASAVMAYAGAYDYLLDSLSLRGAVVEDQVWIMALLSEIPIDGNPVNDFALSSHLYSVLKVMTEPDYGQFYGFSPWQVDFTRVFGANHDILSASNVSLGTGMVQANGQSFVPQMNRAPDYGPGIWNPAPSCNFSSRSGTPVSAITIHTVQGSYAGAISWAQNCSSSVSYHYVVRSSDGQVTQMVYEADKGWHVGSANPYTVGYEHEGYVSNPAWYTTAMYNASSDITRDVVNSGYGINPLRTYNGPASSGLNTLGNCIRIKGHQHYPNQTHTDPGIYWDWERYYKLVNNNPAVISLTAVSGIFYDSGGPAGNYADDEREVFTIAPPGATSVTLTFSAFDLEANWDYLYIYDGSSVNAPLIGTFTGTNSPGSITSSGGSLTVEFRSDCATVNPGWEASWTSNAVPPPPADNTPPVTAVSIPGAWAIQDFTASFTDTDQGYGVWEKYYSVIHFNGTEWRANASNGFFSDNFDAVIHPDWSVVSGTWTIVNGSLAQTDESLDNTNMYASLNQNSADAYLYHWAGAMTGAGTNRRFGFHFMVDNPTLTNRGNSYFVWFRLDNDKVQIYKVVNDVFTLEADVVYDFNINQWYDFKTTYNRNSGNINVYLDNEFVATWMDASPLTTGNHISLRTGDALCYYDNFKVFKSRGAAETITVGAGMDLPYQNQSPTVAAGKIKSFAIDSAYNISSEGQKLVNVDWTAPAAVSLVEDGDATDIDVFYNNTEIRANWQTTDDMHSGLARYWYAIGTTSGGTDVVNWTDNWSFDTLVRTGLNLSVGTMYFVSVKAENGAGLQSNAVSSDGQLLDNPVGVPVASYITGNTILCSGDSITFSNNSQNAVSYLWGFPGGSPATSTVANPKVMYSASGSYTVTLTATGPGGTDSEIQTITISVSQPPVAQFTPSTTTTNLPNALVTFTNTSVHADSYIWDFGDGNTSTDENPWNMFANTGTYDVMLIALNEGCVGDTSFVTITVGTNSLNELASVMQMEIFPNPAEEEITMTVHLPFSQQSGIKLLDAAGRLIMKKDLGRLPAGESRIEVDLAGIAKGIYHLHFHSGDQFEHKQLVIK